MPFRTTWTKFEAYNLIDVGGYTLQVTTDLSRQLYDMSAGKIRATGPSDFKVKELSENVYFYPPLMYSC